MKTRISIDDPAFLRILSDMRLDAQIFKRKNQVLAASALEDYHARLNRLYTEAISEEVRKTTGTTNAEP